MKNSFNKKKINNSIIFPSLGFFIIMIFIPKIDLLPIAGYWQGIRAEDILILAFLLSFISNLDNSIYHDNFRYKSFLIFFIYIFISNLAAVLSGAEVKIILLIRFFEYIVLLYYFDNFEIDKIKLKKILYVYLLLNFFVASLQYFEILGSISSLGYMKNEGNNPMGITGGPWELGAVSSIIFFILYIIENKQRNLIITFIIVNFLLILASGRGNFIAFNAAIFILFLFNPKIENNKKFFYIVVLCILILVIKNYIFIDFFTKIFGINLKYMITLFYEAIFLNELPTRDELENMQIYLSFWYRVKDWSMFINQVTEDNLNILFGLGLSHVYYDSLLIRLFVSTGIFGVVIALILSLKLRMYLLIFFLLSGAFLDLFVSMKIYFFTLLMLYIHTKSKKNNF